MMIRRKKRQPRGEWLDSECAPFIRRILRAESDAERTKVAREWANWLEDRGDPTGTVAWFRHPRLKWRNRDGFWSWTVEPWENNGCGCTSRVDNFWWTAHFPTRSWVESKAAEELVKAWICNRVDMERYPWTLEVATRLGVADVWRSDAHDRARQRERSIEYARKAEEIKAARDVAEFERLKEKFGRGGVWLLVACQKEK